MYVLKNNPIIKILIAWILGILFIPPSLWLIYGLWGFCLSLFLISYVFAKQLIAKNILNSIALFLMIYSLSALHSKNRERNNILSQETKQTLCAQLIEPAKVYDKSSSYIFRIIETENDTLLHKKLIAWTSNKDSLLIELGDRIVLNTTIKPIRNKAHPFEFDYAGYMANNDIYYSSYINEKQIILHKKTGANSISIERLRLKLLSRLKRIASKENFEYLSALSLGYRNELGNETRSYFQQTGTMHILAVSGLHVGIIFSILGFCFKRLIKQRKLLLYFALQSLGLWSYALLTGMSPSVLRATLMFNMIVLAQILNRKTAIYSTLAASALISLIISPKLIYDIGFQLSYAAVLSIVFFQAKLERIWYIRNKPGRWLWQLFTVSVSAQIGTAPLCLYYFNSFASYFWLSNIIALPIATILLYLSIGSIGLLGISSKLDWLLSVTINHLGDALIYLLKLVSSFPHALISNVYISEMQLMVLLLIIICFGICIIAKRKAQAFIYTLALAGCFLILRMNDIYTKGKQQMVLEYADREPIYQLINGKNNYILHNESISPNKQMFSNSITQLRLNEPIFIPISKDTSIYEDDFVVRHGLCWFNNQLIEIIN